MENSFSTGPPKMGIIMADYFKEKVNSEYGWLFHKVVFGLTDRGREVEARWRSNYGKKASI
jgi:hypothetical protein